MLDGCGIETRLERADRQAGRSSRSMLDGCGIETACTLRRSAEPECRDRCSMAVGSRPRVRRRGRGDADGRDRCSMAVGSRRPACGDDPAVLASRSMLDGCGIETHLRDEPPPQSCVAIDARWLWDRDFSADAAKRYRSLDVAIDARWLWDRDRDARSGRRLALRRSRSMLDGCGIETGVAARSPSRRCDVAIDARWLWDRDWRRGATGERGAARRDRCSMAVGSRPTHRRAATTASLRGRDRCSMAVGSRPMPPRASVESTPSGSRSMLDGCGIETTRRAARDACRRRRDRCSMAVGSRRVVSAGRPRRHACRRDRCSMAVGSRLTTMTRAAPSLRWSRSMLDGCGIETTASADARGTPRAVAIDARWLWDRDSSAFTGRRCSRPTSRSMLDGCGIETATCRSRPDELVEVAIDARWLWNRDDRPSRRARERRSRRDRCSMAVESRHRSSRLTAVFAEAVAIDARWLWNRDLIVVLRSAGSRSVAIDARWLWDRDSTVDLPQLSARVVAIDARWLWDRDPRAAERDADDLRSRSMLDGCGIETAWPGVAAVLSRGASRSMLDGCGIETLIAAMMLWLSPRVAIDARWLWDRDGPRNDALDGSRRVAIDARWLWDRDTEEFWRQQAVPNSRDRCSMAVGSRLGCGRMLRECRYHVAIDARWLWDRDYYAIEHLDGGDLDGRDRCSMAVESRQADAARAALQEVTSRSMLDGCGIETLTKWPANARRVRWSRSMLDGCGIETCPLGSAVDSAASSRSMLDGCGIETRLRLSQDFAAATSRSMLDGCGIETEARTSSVSPLPGRDRCSMAVESRLATMPAKERSEYMASRSMLDGCGIETQLSRPT